MVAKELKLENGVWSDKNGSIKVSVVASPKEQELKTIQIIDSNGTTRVMFK
jgi:hypothetical protein